MKRISLWIAPLLMLTVAACGGGGLQKTRPILSVSSTDPIDFEDHPVLQKISKTIEVANIGKAPLQISMNIVGQTAVPLDDAADAGTDTDGGSPQPLDSNVFSFEMKEGPTPSQLTQGASVTVVISIQPPQPGRYSATFVIDSDDVEQPRVEIPLTGSATTSAGIVVDPADCVDFGRVGESRSLVREVTITSVGTSDLELGPLEIGGPATGSFAVLGSKTGGIIKATTPPTSVKIGVKYAPNPAEADANGDVIGSLVLSTNDPLHRTVNVCLKGKVNRQPIADGKIVEPHADQILVAPGTTVGLDASTSSDPDGDVPLTYAWDLKAPEGSAAACIGGNTGAWCRFHTDFPGPYIARLTVTDSAGLSSKVQTITVNAASDNRVRVELIWDHPVADLDLHMRPVGTDLNSQSDCYGYNQQPTDWGSEDPPLHYGDKLSGFGPETIDYVDPANGSYQISIIYNSAQGAADKEMQATLRIYQFGVVRTELPKKLTTPGERWDAAIIRWNDGGMVVEAGSP